MGCETRPGQVCYNLSAPAMEDLLYEAELARRFLRSHGFPSRSRTRAPSCKFRHLLERHELGVALFEAINAHFARHGLRLREGTIVHATIIEAPSSKKNRLGERCPEMHQTKKGKHLVLRDEAATRTRDWCTACAPRRRTWPT